VRAPDPLEGVDVMDARPRPLPRPVLRRPKHVERVATASPEAPNPAEAPFDPTRRWAIPVSRLWPGRVHRFERTALAGRRYLVPG
jgi:hypothetical protein